MTLWATAAGVLVFAFFPLAWIVFAENFRDHAERVFDAVAALVLASTISTLLLVFVAEATHFSALLDVALAAALLTMITALVFVRILEDWL